MSTEIIWEFDCRIIFNDLIINKFAITDHFKLNHSNIEIETIAKIVVQLDGEQIEPLNYSGNRTVFSKDIFYNFRKYRVIFWFKDNTSNYLWIRNCYCIN